MVAKKTPKTRKPRIHNSPRITWSDDTNQKVAAEYVKIETTQKEKGLPPLSNADLSHMAQRVIAPAIRKDRALYPTNDAKFYKALRDERKKQKLGPAEPLPAVREIPFTAKPAAPETPMVRAINDDKQRQEQRDALKLLLQLDQRMGILSTRESPITYLNAVNAKVDLILELLSTKFIPIMEAILTANSRPATQEIADAIESFTKPKVVVVVPNGDYSTTASREFGSLVRLRTIPMDRVIHRASEIGKSAGLFVFDKWKGGDVLRRLENSTGVKAIHYSGKGDMSNRILDFVKTHRLSGLFADQG